MVATGSVWLFRQVRLKADITYAATVRLKPDTTYDPTVRLKPDTTYDPAVRPTQDEMRSACLCTELAEMVVNMKVGPTEPRGFRHPAEYRMRLPVERPRRCGDVIQERFELRDVPCEVDRFRA